MAALQQRNRAMFWQSDRRVEPGRRFESVTREGESCCRLETMGCEAVKRRSLVVFSEGCGILTLRGRFCLDSCIGFGDT